MIELIITKTLKPAGRDQERYRYDVEQVQFDTLTDANAYLKERYARCKRSRMYVDSPSKGQLHVGWVYAYKRTDDGTGRARTYYQQDWVEVWETTRRHLPLTKKGTP